MRFRTDDPVADWERYVAEQEKRFAELPECDYCGHTITEGFYYEINGDTICEGCLNWNFRKSVD